MIAQLRRRPYLDAQGRIDLPRLVADATFPAYGLKGKPLGLRLRSLGWSDSGRGHIIGRVKFGYAAGEPGEPRRAIELAQGPDTMERSSPEGRLMVDLHAVESVVRGYSPKEVRQEYLRRGNFHRDWNLERISRTARRRLTIHVDGAPVKVELAYWWRPQLVVLARLVLADHPVLAASIGVSHIQLLEILKTMVVLQQDADTLAEHRRDYEQVRAQLSPMASSSSLP